LYIGYISLPFSYITVIEAFMHIINFSSSFHFFNLGCFMRTRHHLLFVSALLKILLLPQLVSSCKPDSNSYLVLFVLFGHLLLNTAAIDPCSLRGYLSSTELHLSM
jgi:hypothetical protein